MALIGIGYRAIFERIVGEPKSQQETSEFYEPEEHVRFDIEQRH